MSKDIAGEIKIREQRAKLYKGMVPMIEKLNKGEKLTVEERAEFDKRDAKLVELDGDLRRVMRATEIENGRTELAETRGLSRDESTAVDVRHAQAFSGFLRYGTDRLTPEGRSLLTNPGYVSGAGYERRGMADSSQLVTAPGAPAAGSTGYDAGYMIPQGFWQNLQIALKAYGGIMSKCRMLNTDTGAPMPCPTIDPTAVVGAYIGEGNQVGFTDYSFGQGMLSAWTITSQAILASVQLIEDSAFDVDGFVSDRIGEAIGRKVAQELWTGTGSSALLGIQTAETARGIQAGALGGIYQPVSASKLYAYQYGSTLTNKLTAGMPGFDDISMMVAKIDPAYRGLGNCTWVMNDTTLQLMRTITDSLSRPIWQPEVAAGAPDTFYNYPLLIDQNIGGISTSANVVGGMAFGDFSRAMVVRQVNGAHVMRLVERYADYLDVGYIGYVRMDARSNDVRAALIYESPAS